ncbi:DMT family transporter [Oceanibacterium hippocampi]|uniref:Guanidinium exporter n=1 Tax=Oceanibacterium hippocampi TaxID=745714 RepID=A0A1Y5SMS2_9PROT|nr:multidrug efflux SMR transporter [Oceanibacterium hippocampi]SLN44300.1 Quaternary ammonium compound-resistance protein SugE [Oceanibacterium hippocampi]
MSWLYLVIAGIFEWGWPVGLKYGWTENGVHWGWVAFGVVCMTMSGALLLLSLRVVPMGTAYAVWTGIGAAGTFAIGIMFFAEPMALARIFFVGLILVGIVGLKLSS